MDDDTEKQLGFWAKDGFADARTNCPVENCIDKDDSACLDFNHDNYEVLSCGTEKGAQFLADVRGATLSNVIARKIKIPLLEKFIPSIGKGSKDFLGNSDLDWVAITLPDVISPKLLIVRDAIRTKMGIPSQTKILLLNHGPDSLLEKIWTDRHRVFPEIARLDVDLMTAVNYSVFWNQPHLERVVNIKRSLISFDFFQKNGAKVMPHLYWSGDRDIERWVEWIHQNEFITTISMYWGLFRTPSDWEQQLRYFKKFTDSLKKPVNIIISGPSNERRITQIKEIFPAVTITNGSCSQLSISNVMLDGSLRNNVYPNIPFKENLDHYKKLVSDQQLVDHTHLKGLSLRLSRPRRIVVNNGRLTVDSMAEVGGDALLQLADDIQVMDFDDNEN